MKFAFIAAEKAQYPVAVLCSVLGVSSSGFYAWCKRPPSQRAKADARLAVEVRLAHKRGRGAYGSPRVHRELKAHGHRIGKKRVERLMRQEGIQGRQKRRFRRTTDSNHTQPVAANVLARDFHADAPNTAWVTDVTYVWTAEGWLYVAALLDLFSRRVVVGPQARPTTVRWRCRRCGAPSRLAIQPPAWCTTPTAAALTPAMTTRLLSPSAGSSRA